MRPENQGNRSPALSNPPSRWRPFQVDLLGRYTSLARNELGPDQFPHDLALLPAASKGAFSQS